MKRMITAAMTLMVLFGACAAQATTVATYTSTSAGTLDGVGFTITGWNAAASAEPKLLDVSAGTHGTVTGIHYALGDDNDNAFTVTFDQAIDGLEFYLYYFRGCSGTGYGTYDFGQDFTILSGLSSVPTVGTTQLDTSGEVFVSGAIVFSNPVTSFTVFGLDATGEPAGYQGFTMAVTAGSGGGDPVPEPATLSLLGLGLAGMAARRVRRKAD